MEYFANFFCNVVLFDAFYHKFHAWMENVLQILANFAAFLVHTNENADVSKMMAVFRLTFVFAESTCLGLLAHQILSLYLLPVKS